MERRAPLVILLVGLLVTVAVFVVGAATVRGGDVPRPLAALPPTTTTSTAITTATAATRTTVAAAVTRVPEPGDAGTWAGTVDRGTTMALVIAGGRAVAYVCDGRRTEAWLKGTAEGGLLAMTGRAGAAVTASYGPDGVSGVLRVHGRARPFAMATPAAPGTGLYRAVTAGATGGWIVLPGGRQVGVLTLGGAPRPAPAFDPRRLSVQVGGRTVAVAAVRP